MALRRGYNTLKRDYNPLVSMMNNYPTDADGGPMSSYGDLALHCYDGVCYTASFLLSSVSRFIKNLVSETRLKPTGYLTVLDNMVEIFLPDVSVNEVDAMNRFLLCGSVEGRAADGCSVLKLMKLLEFDILKSADISFFTKEQSTPEERSSAEREPICTIYLDNLVDSSLSSESANDTEDVNDVKEKKIPYGNEIEEIPVNNERHDIEDDNEEFSTHEEGLSEPLALTERQQVGCIESDAAVKATVQTTPSVLVSNIFKVVDNERCTLDQQTENPNIDEDDVDDIPLAKRRKLCSTDDGDDPDYAIDDEDTTGDDKESPNGAEYVNSKTNFGVGEGRSILGELDLNSQCIDKAVNKEKPAQHTLEADAEDDEQFFVFSECNCIYTNRLDFQKHLDDHNIFGFSCTDCSFIIESDEHIEDHNKRVKYPRSECTGRYMCPYCHESVLGLCPVRVHMRGHKEKLKKVNVTICDMENSFTEVGNRCEEVNMKSKSSSQTLRVKFVRFPSSRNHITKSTWKVTKSSDLPANHVVRGLRLK